MKEPVEFTFESTMEALRAFACSGVRRDLDGVMDDWIEGERDSMEVLDAEMDKLEVAKCQARIQVCRYLKEMFNVFEEYEDDDRRDDSG